MSWTDIADRLVLDADAPPSSADEPASGSEAGRAARRRVLGHVLAAVAESRWSAHLALRGSVLLRAAFGSAAREPGDLDFVVVPHTFACDGADARAMLADIAHAAERVSLRSPHPRVLIDAAGAVTDDLWSYGASPGVRIALPWRSDDGPGGEVGLDFAFNERIPVPPESVAVTVPDTGAVSLLAATPEQSLAWKTMWLLDDPYIEPKDLHDALLLAEHVRLPHRLLLDSLVASDLDNIAWLPTETALSSLKLRPGAGDEALAARARFTAFATSVLQEDPGLPRGVYARYAELLRPRLAEYKGRDPRAVARELIAVDRAFTDVVTVVFNELLGRSIDDLPETIDQLAELNPGAPSDPTTRDGLLLDLLAD